MKYYFGRFDNSWGFVDEADPRSKLSGLIELTNEQYVTFMNGAENGEEVVYYNGNLFLAPAGEYYIDNDNNWQKKSNAQKEQEERNYLDMLSLTKREVFLALYNAKGITPEQVRASITDTAALIEFDYATEYYRGNPLINAIGAQLGYTAKDLDYLFKNKQLPTGE
jgi:6-phosphogluconolactonase (cycloisomerase 2 family)